MSVISQPESITNSVNLESKENISKLKSSRRVYIGNLTKCINRVTLLTDDMSNYDEVSLLCNKMEFAVFRIKDLAEKYCDIVSEEEIDKAKQLCNEQELRIQEVVSIYKSFLENMDKVKYHASPIEKFFESDQFWHNKHTKLLKSKDSGSSKSSSKRTSSSSTSSKTSVKSKEKLLKLRHNTTKTKSFVEQAKEQAKRKLDLIRKRQALQEAETLNTLVKAKQQLKVAQMLETLIHDNTNHINNDSLKPFTVVNHAWK